MENKKEVKKKFDGFAVVSFVLGVINPFFFLIFNNLINNFITTLLSWFIIILLSIIFGIVSLIRIKKNKNLKGIALAIIGIVISIILVCTIMTSSIGEFRL